MTIAVELHEDQEDINAGTEMAKEIVMAGLRTASQNFDRRACKKSGVIRTGAQIGGSAGNGFVDKTAQNIAMRLNEKDKKCSGDLGEC